MARIDTPVVVFCGKYGAMTNSSALTERVTVQQRRVDPCSILCRPSVEATMTGFALFPLLVATVLAAACSAPPANERAATTYVVAPYAWLASQRGDVPDDDGMGTEINLASLDNLDAVVMVAAEFRPPGSNWALLADSLYVAFDDQSDTLGIETGVQLIEVSAAYAPENGRGMEVLAGFRYWRLWADLDLLSLTSSRQEESWVDSFVGVRGMHQLGNAWSLSGRADVGGFGVEADWIYQLRTDVRYAFGSSWEAELGYRYVSLNFDDAGFDFELAGPSIGLRWNF